MPPCSRPTTGDDWLALTADELPVGETYDWAVRPGCGAVVLFSGTVRDHADGRDGVEHLTYEAYDELVVPRLADDRDRGPHALADDRAHRAPPSHRPPRASVRSSVARGGVHPAPRRGVRGRALRDRRVEGVGPDLEARDLARRQRVGHRGHTDRRSRDRRCDRRRRHRSPSSPSSSSSPWSSPCVAPRRSRRQRRRRPRSAARSTPCRPRPAGPSSTRSRPLEDETSRRARAAARSDRRPSGS